MDIPICGNKMSEGLILLPLHTFKCIFYLLPLSRAGLCVIYAQWKAVNPVYAYKITAPGAVHTYYLEKQLQGNDWPRLHKLKELAGRPTGCLPGISNVVHSLPLHHNSSMTKQAKSRESIDHTCR